MEIWEKWVPVEGIFSRFYIDTIENNTEGVFITLKNNNLKKSIEIIFDGSMYSDCVTQRDGFLKKISELKKKYGTVFCNDWSLFKVENSDYLQWLKEESYGVYAGDGEYKMRHFVILGSNLIFEILAPYEPTVQFVEEK